MKTKVSNNALEVLCLSILATTIAMTPWINQDSLIIPKLVILFATAAYFAPKVIFSMRKLRATNVSRVIIFLAGAIITQMLLVLFISGAPFEQQLYGRTGRGLGFITEFSLLIILLASFLFIKPDKLRVILLALVIASFITSIYSIMQRFDLDIFNWTTRTNGIIGTLGNPNFQSSFAAMAVVPALTYFWNNKKYLSIFFSLPPLLVIYISQSTQGYVVLLASILIASLIYARYKSYKLFFGIFLILAFVGILVTIGVLNRGPLAKLLFKTSVQSRWDFYKTSWEVVQDNPYFGVGLDSLGDFYLMYRDPSTTSSIQEFADNSHNILLNYAATGGFPLAALQALLVLLTLYSYFKIQKKFTSFNMNLTSLLCAWICYQLQSLISPANISMLAWNALISGSIIGLANQSSLNTIVDKTPQAKNGVISSKISLFLILLSIVISYPYFNTDRQILKSAKTRDATLALKSVKSFPQSSVRYAQVGREFVYSNLPEQALELARAAVKYNPNAVSGWLLILVNNYAPVEERIKAKQEVLRLDPFNKEIASIVITDTSKS
jgi:hypothetical protein